MNMFNTGNMSMVPPTPQLPQMPFGLGINTFTDFIGLTEPTQLATPIPRHQSPIPLPQHQRHQITQQLEKAKHQNFMGSNNYQQHDNQYTGDSSIYTNKHQYSTNQRPVSLATYTQTTYSSQALDGLMSIPPVVFHQSSSTNPSTISTTSTTGIPEPQQQHSPTSNLYFESISIPKIPTTRVESPTKPTTLVVPQKTSSELFVDPAHPVASPTTTSGTQIALINLRQKLSRDIQNNMKVVTDQQKKIQDLQSRADVLETGYSHLKCDFEDLKRKNKEHGNKLNEIDSLVKSALTMSSFSSATALQVNMIEAENEIDTMLVVAAIAEY